MNAFEQKKESILAGLSKPAEQYSDRSPKGSVDPQIRDLVDTINSNRSLVTTSSCSGRISVFLEGRKESAAVGAKSKPTNALGDIEPPPGVLKTPSSNPSGGKGFGGKWLFVSHEPLKYDREDVSLHKLFNLKEEGQEEVEQSTFDLSASRLIHLKFEPMILHVLAADATVAHNVLVSAHQAGLRESGASNIAAESQIPQSKVYRGTSASASLQPIPLAIRTTGMAFDNIVGFAPNISQDSADDPAVYRSLVSERYLHILIAFANEKFAINAEKMRRFDDILQARLNNSAPADVTWEDAATRRERKKREGLLRRDRMLELHEPQQNQANAQCAQAD